MIREINKDDLNAVYHLVQQLETYKLDRKKFKHVFEDILSSKDKYAFVFEENNEVVGFCSFYVLDYLHHNRGTAEIVELVVDGNHRNNHIGEKLIQHVETLAHKLDLEEIELSTSLWREDAHRFYKRVGFINDHYTFLKKF